MPRFQTDLLLLSALITLCGAAGAGEAGKPLSEIKGYRSWKQATPKPVSISSQLYLDCRAAPAPGTTPPAASPHRDRYIRVYVSRSGEPSLRATSTRFPPGSILVKEKLRSKDGGTPLLMTVMLKRSPGFDPANGDWEYTVTDAAGRVLPQPGGVKHCQSCHQRVRKTDYVFGSYLMAPAERPIF